MSTAAGGQAASDWAGSLARQEAARRTLSVLRRDFIPLSRAAMWDVGPAAQTLGAIRIRAGDAGETFASACHVAALARLSRRTLCR